MRDIRGDLQDLADLLEEQINDADARFEEQIKQYKQEHDSGTVDLRSEIEAVHTLMRIENQRFGAPKEAVGALQFQEPQEPKVQPLHPRHAQGPRSEEVHEPQARQPQAQGQRPQQRLADFLVNSVRQLGAMSKDELCRLTLKQGYFPNRESAEPGVHAILTHVVEAGLMRQLQDGKFALPTLLSRLRLTG